LLSPHSVPALLKVLENGAESDMVRHEAAEALGGIATPEVLPHLKEWMVREDSPRVVRESCQVALDMWEASRPFTLLFFLRNGVNTLHLLVRKLKRIPICHWSARQSRSGGRRYLGLKRSSDLILSIIT